MFLSESIVRAIHADRTRDIERATRERRMLEAASEARAEAAIERETWLAAAAAARQGRTRLPA